MPAEKPAERAGIEVVAAARAETDQHADRLAGIERFGIGGAGRGGEGNANGRSCYECSRRNRPAPGSADHDNTLRGERIAAGYSAATWARCCTSVLTSCSGEAVLPSMPQPFTHS